MTHEITKTDLSLNTHWFLNEINKKPLNDFESCYPNGNDFVFKYKVPVLQAHTDALNTLLLQHDSDFSFLEEQKVLGKDLLIQNNLEERFKTYNFNSVDFKRHLKPEIALNKKVTRREDGRPDKAEYFFDVAATINFYFIIDSDSGLVQRRTEELVYKKLDNTDSPKARIKDKIYDLNNSYDAAKVLEERRHGRALILDEIKATLLGVLSLANPNLTSTQVIGLGVQFFHDKEVLVNDFINLGTEDFKNDLANINLGTTTYTWLLVEISAGVNLRDYIVSRLTYTAETNHPEA
jgi:hypothetical protein